MPPHIYIEKHSLINVLCVDVDNHKYSILWALRHWKNLATSYKTSSDLKQNGTQKKEPVSGKVFHTLSPGVPCFFARVSFKNH